VFAVLPYCFYLLAYKSTSPFKSAWWFGFGYFGAGISWVHVSIAEFGGLPLIASIALMVLLCGYLALFPAFLISLVSRFFKPALWPLCMPFAWLSMEWLRGRLFTGFPWLSIAYSQSNNLLSAWYPLIGEFGLSALVIAACCSLAIGLAQKRWWLATLPMVFLFASSAFITNIQWTSPTGASKTLALVQGNIEQSMRFDPEEDQRTMEKYLELTETLWHKDIIIWPEAAIPKLESLAQPFLIALDEKATKSNTGLITGIVNYNLQTNIAYNSLIALGIDEGSNNFPYVINHRKRFSKHHLLPIGEFVPFESYLRTLAPIFDLPMSSFSRGPYIQNNLVAGNTRFVPAICFEIAFPQQVAANINSASQAIITVSNDAWFGDSHGPHQHLQIAQVRAKEFGLPVLRATNNGVTAIIDHEGKIQNQLPQFQALVLEDSLTLVKGKTPYRTFGDLPIWLISIIGFVLSVYMRKKA
jgi:apolipoprotein N-acyltransferase